MLVFSILISIITGILCGELAFIISNFIYDSDFNMKKISKIDIFLFIISFVFYGFLIVLYKNDVVLLENIFTIITTVFVTLFSSLLRSHFYNKKYF